MTRAALEKNRITLTALAIVLIGGLFSYFTLPQAEDPGFTIRTAVVVTYFPGAGPDRVESLVTDKIEAVVQQIPELDYVTSESRTGVSIVTVNVQQAYTAMRPIWDNLRRKVEGARGDLPEGVRGPFVNDEFGDVFGVLIGLTAEGYSYAEMKEIADEVRDELLRVPDAAKVEIYGAQDERIFVEYSDARLAELNLSVQQLRQILESANIVIPGGSVQVGRERIALEPSGNFESLEDLRRTVIRLPGRSQLLYLEDVATVTRGYVDPPTTMVRVSGAPGLVIGVSMRDGGNVLRLGEGVRAVVSRLQAAYPVGVEFTTVADQPVRVDQKVNEFVGNLLQAIAIVLLVMLISLGLRTGLVVATLIPAAMLMTLLIMNVMGIGLDQMSLASLIIALGMLIDNAIVMSESILVQMQAGKSAWQAAVDSGNELRVPLLTSSLTTAAAFLPMYLAKSTSGEYVGVIFLVVTITLISSWILSLTMTPLLCVKFLRVPAAKAGASEPFQSPFYRRYRAGILAALRRPWTSLGVAAAALVVAMIGFGLLPVQFFPKSDRTIITTELSLPIGTDITATERMVDDLEAFVRDELSVTDERPDGILNWSSFVGGGQPRWILTMNMPQPRPSYAYLLMNASSYPAVRPLIERIEAFCAERFPDAVASVLPSDLGPPVTKPVQVRLSGPDPDVLFGIADSLRTRMAAAAGTRNIEDDWGRRAKKLIVQVSQPRARLAGLTSQDVAVSLQSTLSGIVSTEFREESDLIPVTLRSVAADRQDIGKIEGLNVYSQVTGRAVPLLQVADVRVAWQPAKVLRRDRTRTVTLSAELDPGVTATQVNEEIVPWLEEHRADWPFGYTYELGGEVESSVEANRSIGEQMPLAILLIVLLLVVQFNSIRRPLIILATIPLGLIGVVLGLHLTGSLFGFMTLLGIISLAGIIINNAIVLLDRIRIEIEENGLSPQQAILESAQRRLRPILLTTMTTVGGLLPLWFGGGPMWAPMAIAIIFGLLFATVLTLGFVPVLYSIVFKVSFRGFRDPAGPSSGGGG